MKTFDEFKLSLTKDEITNISNKAKEVLDEAREDFSKNPKTNLGNQIVTISMFISLGLLERYHEWLQQNS